jgi:hypothetical protein
MDRSRAQLAKEVTALKSELAAKNAEGATNQRSNFSEQRAAIKVGIISRRWWLVAFILWPTLPTCSTCAWNASNPVNSTFCLQLAHNLATHLDARRSHNLHQGIYGTGSG